MFDNTNQYELNLVINGQPLTEYQHQGLVFVEGRTNSNYELRIKNNSPERILAIPSVDGLSIIDGKPAGPESQGYVLEPYQTLNIPGWKVDADTASKFQFGSATGSYSNRTGRGKKNVGVIGMMVFRPKYVPPVNFYPSTSFTFTDTSSIPNWDNTLLGGSAAGSGLTSDSFDGVAMAAPAMASPSSGVRGMTLNSATVVGSNAIPKSVVSQNLGTEYGDAQKFQTVTTTFEKRDPNYPDAIVCIYYDDANGLEARGIILPYRNSSPQAFPSYSNTTTYAAPPPGWRK